MSAHQPLHRRLPDRALQDTRHGSVHCGARQSQNGRSYMYFTSSPESLKDIIEHATGIRVLLENDTRARCYAEYFTGDSRTEKNMLYLHLAGEWP